MRKIIILQGLPASGKTTWAKQKCAESNNKYKRINKDDLRGMIDDGKWSELNEKFILNARDNLIMQGLHDGYDIIVDDTNLSLKHFQQIKAVAEVLGRTNIKTEIKTKFFDVSLEECIKRDSEREKSVGKEVITDMYDRYIKPKPEAKTK